MGQLMLTRRAFTRADLLGIVAGAMLLTSVGLGALQDVTQEKGIAQSLSNLRSLGMAHATYASEWDGRQWTTCPNDLSVIVNEGQYPTSYDEGVPAVPLGFDRHGRHYDSRQGHLIQPFYYPPNCSLGSFRGWHTKPFNQYINSKVYDPLYWAPLDYTTPEAVAEYFEDPGEWPGEGTPIYYPTYCMAMSAMLSFDVFRPTPAGGFQDPRTLKSGFRSPAMAQALYSDLKTHMLEHYWLHGRPSDAMPNSGGVPWFFNTGAGASPATLFYDGHVQLLQVKDVLTSNRRVVEQGGDGLWIDEEPSCFSGDGYFHSYAQDQADATSFHVFTAGGIRGRDIVDEPN